MPNKWNISLTTNVFIVMNIEISAPKYLYKRFYDQ